MCPGTVCRSAPNVRIVARMPRGVVSGAYTRTGRPAAAAYAASAAPALPAVGTTNPGTPSALARVTAALMPRALKEPVGFNPSSLIQKRPTPNSRDSSPDSSSGVAPSPSETGVSPHVPSTAQHVARRRELGVPDVIGLSARWADGGARVAGLGVAARRT